MPRHARQRSSSKTFHIMLRGNERKNIFLDDDDRARFIDTIREKSKQGEFTLYAYCLMDNHVHLVLAEGTDQIDRIMKRVNTSYAYYFNRKYKRVGHVFQDRFKSETIDSEGQLLNAIRYVHNNPVKAEMVKEPGQYGWSSYMTYISNLSDSLIDTEGILRMFASEMKRARELFAEYTAQCGDEAFIEYSAAASEDCEMAAKEMIKEFIVRNNVTMEMLKERKSYRLRNELIRELKDKTILSIRQIAYLLGINRNMVQRA